MLAVLMSMKPEWWEKNQPLAVAVWSLLFIIPFAVVLSLPVGVFGSFFLLKVMGLQNDIYAQIGLIMLVGKIKKNDS